MPIDCPSRTGNGIAPKSRTMWCVWLWKPASVQLTLPTTLALVGFFGPNRFVYACAADHGGTVAPYAALLNGASPFAASGLTASTGSAPASAAASGATPSAESWSAVSSAGSSSQVSCSSIAYARAFGTVRQLSIEPVGHGAMHAMQ